MGNFEVAFLGTNGSVSYNNGNRAKYGTNSICVAVKAGDETMIFDTGTGVCGFNSLADDWNFSNPTHIFYSHYHADHLCGLLFFSYLFNSNNKFDFYGCNFGGDIKSVIDNFLSPPIHPVGLDKFKAHLQFNTIEVGDVIRLSEDVIVKTCGLSHPGGAVGYRVEYDDKSFVYCLDSELANHKDDEKLREFMKGADLLVMDSFFDDGKIIETWGHSSWKECALWAKDVNAKRLALCQHDFKLTDAELFIFEEKAKEIFPETFATSDFMRVTL